MVSVWSLQKIFTHKYIVVLGVTILHGRNGSLGSRVDLAWKSANITGIIAVRPLQLL